MYRTRVRELSPSNRSHDVHHEPEPHRAARTRTVTSGPQNASEALLELPRLDGHLILGGDPLEEGGPLWVVQRSTRPSSVVRLLLS
jgi:hypothetical protein